MVVFISNPNCSFLPFSCCHFRFISYLCPAKAQNRPATADGENSAEVPERESYRLITKAFCCLFISILEAWRLKECNVENRYANAYASAWAFGNVFTLQGSAKHLRMGDMPDVPALCVCAYRAAFSSDCGAWLTRESCFYESVAVSA